MKKEAIENIFKEFIPLEDIIKIDPLTSGHINDTYLIHTKSSKYVLQKLNHQVFRNIPELMNNKVKLSRFLKTKKDFKLHMLTFFPSKSGEFYFQNEDGNYWSLMNYIEDSKVLELTENKDQAYQAGKAFGHFAATLSDFKAEDLYEIIPDFHKMSFRFQQFDEALKNASEERKKKSHEWIDLVLQKREQMHSLEELHEQGKIPLRVTHNDTKLSNLLFNEQNKAIAVIDWDTLMPGIIHYDFGDSVRSICSTATEDETNLEKVNLNSTFYESYRSGFLEETDSSLSDLEIELLPLAAETITFIMGLRFLTDYLNNDVYYKIKYPLHNLHRAANQLHLSEQMRKAFLIPI